MSRVITKGIDVPVEQIKSSPYQPRLEFDLEDIKGSIMRDGILVPLVVRKEDGYYELVDGERRWRVVRELGYKTVPCDVINIDDDTARRMVWKVNTLRKDYTPNEKAKFFKRMQKEYGMSYRSIAREYDTGPHDVKAYLNVFKLPEEYQQMVWDRLIPIRNIRELEQLFNGVTRVTPEKNTEIFEILDRSAKERHFGAEQIREAIKPYLAKFRSEQIEKAKDALAEIKPEVKEPKTAEELEEMGKALIKEAKKRKPPEQILEEKRKKAGEALLNGKGNILSRIKEAKRLGTDTADFEKRVDEIKAMIVDDPDKAYGETQKLKNEINKLIRQEKRRRQEATIELKLRQEEIKELLHGAKELGIQTKGFQGKVKEIKAKVKDNLYEALEDAKQLKKAISEAINEEQRLLEEERLRQTMEEAKQKAKIELAEDKEFLETAIQAQPTPSIQEIETTPTPVISPEDAEKFRRRGEELERRLREISKTQEAQARGQMFKNWVAHQQILAVLGSVQCPICGSPWTALKWECCKIDLKKSFELIDHKIGEGREN